MSTRRMITVDIWEDEFIGGLSFFGRILWFGLITLADDQGRLLDNSLVIQRRVFLYDENVKTQQVTDALQEFAQSGKVVTYEAAGKKLLQIVNWWKYQTPQWPQASKYPPPPGWTDRVKEHVQGSNTVRKVNWESAGGFQPSIPEGVPSDVPMGVPSDVPMGINDGYGEVNLNDGEVKVNKTPPPEDTYLGDLSAAFCNASGIPELTGGAPKWIAALEELNRAGVTAEDITQAVGEMRNRGYTVVSLRSIVNPSISAMSKRKGKDKIGGSAGGAIKVDPGFERQRPNR